MNSTSTTTKTKTKKRTALAHIDPLPDIDRCHDVNSVTCNIANDSQTNKDTYYDNMIHIHTDTQGAHGWEKGFLLGPGRWYLARFLTHV